MSGAQVVWALIKILVMIGFVVKTAAILTWLDLRQCAMMQDRVGPNRAVVKIFGREFRLAGLLHPAADGLKFFTKEFYRPPRADVLLFTLAPILSMMPVMALVAVVPFGDTLCLGDIYHVASDGGGVWNVVPRFGTCGSSSGAVPFMVATLNVGLLYVFAIAGQGIVAAAIAGWSSDNKYSLMGALRAASQMVSYEVAMGLTLIGTMMIYGSIRLDDMVRWQGDHAWGIFVQPVAFILFCTAAVAETKRIPFDLPEAESELVSGYFTEYSGMTFGMFYFAEYMEVVTSSMLVVTLFLGGWELPFLHRDGLTIQFGEAVLVHQVVPHIWMEVISVLAFFGKVAAVCWLQCIIRWSLPRFRYDQLQKLGWRVLSPARARERSRDRRRLARDRPRRGADVERARRRRRHHASHRRGARDMGCGGARHRVHPQEAASPAHHRHGWQDGSEDGRNPRHADAGITTRPWLRTSRVVSSRSRSSSSVHRSPSRRATRPARAKSRTGTRLPRRRLTQRWRRLRAPLRRARPRRAAPPRPAPSRPPISRARRTRTASSWTTSSSTRPRTPTHAARDARRTRATRRGRLSSTRLAKRLPHRCARPSAARCPSRRPRAWRRSAR